MDDKQTEAGGLTKQEEATLLAYGTIFNQLLLSDKFRMFMDTYYTVQRIVDEEQKEITLQVIENPPEVVVKKIAEFAGEAAKEEASKIQLVEGGTMGKKVLDQAIASAKKAKQLR
ncbi:MAG: hypothetical protein EBS53_00615 [Bacteroidetes bacterium]|nr:hypothetical protein [Bacteroidota bacterium]